MTLYPTSGISDPISSLTHFFGAVVFSIAAYWLIKRSLGCRARTATVCIFVASTIFLLVMSGFYHVFDRGGNIRDIVGRFDHVGIFLLIAGTFTPSIFILTDGINRWFQLSFIWIATVAAMTTRLFFFSSIPHGVGVGIYLAIGWCGVIPAVQVARRYGLDFSLPLYLGAIAYTVGGILEATGYPTIIPGVFGPHEQFHLAVLLGISAHWRFIYSFANGRPREISFIG